MSDHERKHIIALLTGMYSQQDTLTAISCMPTLTNDPNNEEFEKYFNFLQSLYLLQSDFINMDEKEISERLTHLKLAAYHFKYPMQQLEAFDVSQPDT